MLPYEHEERRQDEDHEDALGRHGGHQSLQRLRVTRAASVLKRAAKTERAPVQCMGAGETAAEVRGDEVTVEARAAEVRVVAARVEVRAEGAMALCGTGEPCAHLWQNYGEREADQ